MTVTVPLANRVPPTHHVNCQSLAACSGAALSLTTNKLCMSRSLSHGATALFGRGRWGAPGVESEERHELVCSEHGRCWLLRGVQRSALAWLPGASTSRALPGPQLAVMVVNAGCPT